MRDLFKPDQYATIHRFNWFRRNRELGWQIAIFLTEIVFVMILIATILSYFVGVISVNGFNQTFINSINS